MPKDFDFKVGKLTDSNMLTATLIYPPENHQTRVLWAPSAFTKSSEYHHLYSPWCFLTTEIKRDAHWDGRGVSGTQSGNTWPPSGLVTPDFAQSGL